MRRSLPIILLLPLVAVAMVGDERAPDAVASATAFLASLDKDQHRSAVKTFDDDYRTFWRYTPATRQGIAWKDMTADQTAKAVALLKSCLSDLGYQRTQTVREVEAVLGQMENNRGRDRDNYLFTFFGAPSESEVWAWRYEGHHVSLNFTYRGSKLVSSTPQFFGSNPAEVPSGEQKGLRVLAKEEDLGIALLASLTPEQRKAAIVADQAPSEIATAESRVAAIQKDTGLHFHDMTKAQQASLMDLIWTNAAAQREEEAKNRLDKIEKAGKDKIVFAWMGKQDRTGAHYYRIQGPTFLIEFDNSQNSANHIHVVWRDFDGDFGRDVLKEHYEQHEHDPAHGLDH